MGAVAGSGGYFVACPADVIVASGSTITGSIGVFGGKMVTAGLLDRVGLHHDAVHRGAHARMQSPYAAYTDEDVARLDTWLDAVYADFVGKVADGRGMTRDDVHAVAKGRIWTGADAAERGLVDTLGGLRDAIRVARERGGLTADAPVRPAVSVPMLARLKTPRSSEDPRAAAAVGMWSAGWGDLATVAQAMGLPAIGPLMMPGVSVA
jgi:protease-4